MQKACCRVPGGHLLLVFRLGVVPGIMAFLITVIARDFGGIPPAGTVPTSPLWGFLLGFSDLTSVGLGGIGFGDILLALGGASLFVPLPSSTHLFPFSPSTPRGF